MSEPTGHTIDGTPWEEPRGPHFPGRVERSVARIPRPAWFFIAAAVINAVWQVRADRIGDTEIGQLAWWIVGRAAPSVIVCLFGAALLIRHPRAWTTERGLVYGSILFVVAEFADLLIRTLQSSDQFAGWFFYDSGFSTDPPWGLALYTISAILTIGAIVALAVGLRIGSTWRSSPRTAGAIWVLAAATVGANLATYPLSLDGATYEWFFVAFFAAGTITTTITIVALAYLATVAAAGASNGEQPRPAWIVAALGAIAIVTATLTSSVASIAGLTFNGVGAQPDWTLPLAYVASVVRTAGFIAILAAFALGLPSQDDAEPAG